MSIPRSGLNDEDGSVARPEHDREFADADEDCGEARDEFQRFIEVLVVLRFERQLGESDPAAFKELMDMILSSLVEAEKERTSGAPTIYAEIAKRILRAEASWTRPVDGGRENAGSLSRSSSASPPARPLGAEGSCTR
jgi:hypothetical protein